MVQSISKIYGINIPYKQYFTIAFWKINYSSPLILYYFWQFQNFWEFDPFLIDSSLNVLCFLWKTLLSLAKSTSIQDISLRWISCKVQKMLIYEEYTVEKLLTLLVYYMPLINVVGLFLIWRNGNNLSLNLSLFESRW